VYAAIVWLALLAIPAGGDAAQSAHTQAHEATPLLASLGGWFLMCAAMMLPPALPHARHLALTSMWHRRQRTIALFLASYLLVWMAFGLTTLAALDWIQRYPDMDSASVLASALVAAAIWTLSPTKWRALRACHIVASLPPDGRPADVACVSAGLRYGWLCFVASWPAMLSMLIAGHGAVLLMTVLFAILMTEKVLARPSQLRDAIAAVFTVTALLVLAS
jgi:predicted metal-binding membrane protein